MNEKGNAEGMYMGAVLGNESYAKDFRLYGLQNYWLEKTKKNKIGRNFTEQGIFVGRNRAKFSFVVQLLAGYIYIYVSVMAMSVSISTGDVLMYAGAIITMMTGVQEAISKYNAIAYNNEYLKLYEEFINRPNMHYDGTLPIEKRDDKRYELSFYNVSFKYPGSDKYILKDINMTFNIGEKLALVGLNGAGKTTLIKLLLRLYEPTAALDPIAEAEIYENFDTLVGDKTAIYISHRMSSCKFCDRIVVINNGRIEEEGSHDSLMEKNRLYAKMYNTQANYYV